MGAYSTIYLTRQQAREAVIREVLACDDKMLEKFADIVYEPRLYNVSVTETADEYYQENPDMDYCNRLP